MVLEPGERETEIDVLRYIVDRLDLQRDGCGDAERTKVNDSALKNPGIFEPRQMHDFSGASDKLHR